MCSCHILIGQMFQTFFNARSTIISVTPNSSSDRKEQDKEQEKTFTTVPATTIFRRACLLTQSLFLTFNNLNYLTVALPRNVNLELSIYLVLVRHCPLQSFPTGIPPTLSSCHLQLNTKPRYGHYINTFSLQQRRYVTSAFPRSPTYRTRKFDRFLNPFYVIPLHSLTCLNFRDVCIYIERWNR